MASSNFDDAVAGALNRLQLDQAIVQGLSQALQQQGGGGLSAAEQSEVLRHAFSEVQRSAAEQARAVTQAAQAQTRAAEQAAREQARIAERAARDQVRAAEQAARAQEKAAEQAARAQTRAAEQAARAQEKAAEQAAREQARAAKEAAQAQARAAEQAAREARKQEAAAQAQDAAVVQAEMRRGELYAQAMQKQEQRQRELHEVGARAALDVAHKQQAGRATQRQGLLDEALGQGKERQGLLDEALKGRSNRQTLLDRALKDQAAEKAAQEKDRQAALAQAAQKRQAMLQTGLSGDVGGLLGAAGGGPAAIALAAIAGLERGFAGVAHTARVLNDETTTTTEKMQRLSESLPLVGGLARSFREMVEELNGVSNAIRMARQESERYQAVLAVEARFKPQIAAATLESKRAGYEAQGLSGLSFSRGPTGRGTLAEQYAYQEARTLAPARLGVQMARIRETAGRRGLQDIDRMIAGKDDEMRALQWQANMARRRYGGLKAADEEAGRSRPWIAAAGTTLLGPAGGAGALALDRGGRKGAMLEALEEEGRANAGLRTAQEQRLNLVNMKRQEELRLSQMTTKALAEQAQAELGVLRARESRAQGQAQRLGLMNRMEFEQAAHALALYKQHGPEGVTPQVAALAQSVGGESVAKWAESLGEQRRARLRDITGEPGGEFRDTLGGIRKDVDTKEQEAARLQKEVAVGVAKDMERIFKEFTAELLKAMQAAMNLAKQEVERNQQQRARSGQ